MFPISVPVFTLESSSSNPRLKKLTSNHIPLYGEPGDDNLQTLIHNNSQQTEILRGQIWALQGKVTLLFICNTLYSESVQNCFCSV